MSLTVLAGIGLAVFSWRTESPPPAPRSLTVSIDVKRPLAGGERHNYRAMLAVGDAFHAIVTQYDVDVTVSVLDPRGESLLTVDGPNGPDGPEAVAIVASSEGEHLLAVEATGRAPGSYRLEVETLGPAGDRDRARAAGMQFYARAERRRRQQTAVALRDALRDYRQALDQFHQAGEVQFEARTQRRIGSVLLARGDPGAALPHFERALEYTLHHGNGWEQVPLYNDAGEAYRRIGDPDRAQESFERAIAVARPLGFDAAVAVALNNLGLVHASLGEMQEALSYYHRALELWRRQGDQTRQANVLHNLGVHYLSLGRLDEGRDHLHRALVMFRETADLDGQAATLNAIGWGQTLAEDFAAALATYDQALGLQRAVGDEQGQSGTLDQIGTVYLGMGRYGEALDAYQQALRLAGSNRLDQAYTRLNSSAALLAMGRPQAALEPASQALQTFRETGVWSGQAAALAANAQIERQLGRWALAHQHLQAAVAIIESVRGRLQSPWLRASYLARRLDVVGDTIDLLIQLEVEEPDQGHAVAAFEASERARARTLLEQLMEARAGVRARVAPELLDRERLLRAKINTVENRRLEYLAQGSTAQATAVEPELRTLLLEYEKIQGEISTTGVGSRSGPKPLSLEEIQQQVLDDDALLLAYTLGEERSFLWVIDRDSLECHVLPPRSRIAALARRANQLLPKSHRRGFRQQASTTLAELSAAVLGPAAGRLGDQRLLIVAEGALHYVPFAVLTKPQPAGDDGALAPLLAAHEIVYLPSASVLAVLRQELTERRQAPGLLAVVADPVFQPDDPRLRRTAPDAASGPKPAFGLAAKVDLERNAEDFGTGFERLPHAGVEAESILALSIATESLLATGFEANRELVLSGQLDRYRIVHFATHSLINAKHPALSGIVLSLIDETGRAREGLLRVHEIYGLSLSADLVVLSGCRTALGKRVRGEGLLGLTHGFLYAGAARLVVSYWNVDDRATAELMTRFYRGMLEDGLPPAQALRAAQLSMLAEAEWRAPYYWAGFSLHGEWR